MDFVQILSAARVPKWIQFGSTPIELKITTITTTELDRCRRMAQVKNRTDLKKLLPLTYKKTIHGFRGLTLQLLEDQFGLQLDTLECNGKIYTRDEEIAADPIDDYWLSFITGLGVVVPQFNYWVMEHNGQNILTEEAEEDEEKKTT